MPSRTSIPVRDDFAAFILTHNRPNRMRTYSALRSCGYTGRIYIVCDDSDPALEQYRKKFGDDVLVFSKEAIADQVDAGDNVPGLRGVVYARNALWALAESVGVRYFIELDDDYSAFSYRRRLPLRSSWIIRDIDRVFGLLIEFLEATGAATVAMCQGGDHMGGDEGNEQRTHRVTRKAMNSFVCDVTRPFPFMGRINEDVNAYVSLGNRGVLFFTYWMLQITQLQTQRNPGGLTELYLDSGTYLKSFYTVMYAPSCVQVTWSSVLRRFHHSINWRHAVPKIIAERHKVAA
jgi:hypothetical protein